MTIGEMIVLYKANHLINLKTRLNTSRRLDRYLAPFAALQLDALTKLQVVQWHQEIGRTHQTAANQALETLRAMYTKADDWELYSGRNPATRIKKFPKRSRHRFIQSNEMPYLLKSLSAEGLRVEGYFLCLLLTGARRDEARLMQWTHLDLDRALWNKPTSKNGHPHTIPLPDQLVARLRALPRVTDFVFSSCPNPKNHFTPGEWSVTAIEHQWRRIRARVGLNDVRIHDLRRTAASWLAISGSNLPVIQSMLNHTSISSTQVYARLSLAPVARALNDQCERMLGPMPVPVVVRPSSNGEGLSVREQMQEWPG